MGRVMQPCLMGCEHAVPRRLVLVSLCTAATSLNILDPTWVPASSIAKYMYLQDSNVQMLVANPTLGAV